MKARALLHSLREGDSGAVVLWLLTYADASETVNTPWTCDAGKRRRITCADRSCRWCS